jgi:hypothetical protein
VLVSSYIGFTARVVSIFWPWENRSCCRGMHRALKHN